MEWANDLAVDSEDNVVVTGITTSDDFPTMNAYQGERTGSIEMFITKFAADGDAVVFSTYVGGSQSDYANAITTDSQDRIIVTGQTNSADFPTTIPITTTESLFNNVTLLVLDPVGSPLLSMMFGGSHHDLGIGVAWHSDDSYISSDDFPIKTAYQETNGGDNDMFITKLDLQGLIDLPTPGYSFGLLEGGLAIGILVVVVLLLMVKKRTR